MSLSCSICYDENKKHSFKCLYCNEGIICRDCIYDYSKMICDKRDESGMTYEESFVCPICQNRDWKTTFYDEVISTEFSYSDIIERVDNKDPDYLKPCFMVFYKNYMDRGLYDDED